MQERRDRTERVSQRHQRTTVHDAAGGTAFGCPIEVPSYGFSAGPFDDHAGVDRKRHRRCELRSIRDRGFTHERLLVDWLSAPIGFHADQAFDGVAEAGLEDRAVLVGVDPVRVEGQRLRIDQRQRFLFIGGRGGVQP